MRAQAQADAMHDPVLSIFFVLGTAMHLASLLPGRPRMIERFAGIAGVSHTWMQAPLGRPSMGSLVSKSRPSEVWEGLAHMLGVKNQSLPELPPGSAPLLRIDAPLVKVIFFVSLHFLAWLYVVK